MQSQLSCPLCNFEFSDQKTPRIISMCGHTFCQECIQTLIMPNGEEKFRIVCPQDDVGSELMSNEIKQFPVNKVLLKIVESNKSKSSFKDSSFDVSKIVKQQELQEDEETKELISAIQQSQQEESQLQVNKSQEPNPVQVNNSTMHTESKKQQGAKKQEQQDQRSESSQQDENICLLHQKPLQVVCVVDLQKICAKCALFGKHKGHDFKSLQQIEQENNAFYHQLLAVYDEKTVVLTRVEKKQTKTDLLAILMANKDNLVKQIKEKYKKLIDAIKIQEKKALTKLQKFAQKIQKDIDDLYNIQPALIEKYEEWERLSFEKLQIIEKGSFEEKLQLLLVQQADHERNIIVQGNALVEKIKHQQNHILSKAQHFLTNMNMKSTDKIFDFVETYVEVYDKPSQLPKIQPTKTQLAATTPKQLLQNHMIYYSGKKHSQDDLLDVGQNQDRARQEENLYAMEFQPANGGPRSAKKQQPFKFDESKFVPVLHSKVFEEKPVIKQESKPQTKRSSEAFTVEQLKKKVQVIAPQINLQQNAKNQDSYSTQKVVRPPKKKLKSIKVPEKYEKILDGLYADNSQTLDLTNAELGDSVILQICEFVPGTKLKTIKFIRNKLTDECVLKMLPYLGNVITLNLSQNLLTERVLDVFIDNRQLLPKVKNIILSLNKIIERKHKNKIDELRKFDITVSV